MLRGVAPFAVARLGVISTGWGGKRPLGAGLILIAAAFPSLLLFARSGPEWQAREKERQAVYREPSLYKCGKCGRRAVERRVDHSVHPPFAIIIFQFKISKRVKLMRGSRL
jgi:hypothetical protein